MKQEALKIPVVRNEIITMQIDTMAYDNAAIGRYKDFVVMVDRGAPGDEVKVEITLVKENYARGKIIEIISSNSEYRIDPKCKLFKVCGGCQWQHLPYEKQLEQKDLLMGNFTKKLNLEDEILKNILPANSSWKYRNKVQYPVRTVESTGRLKAGYFEWNSNDLINVKHCPIQYDLFEEIIETIRELAPKYRLISKSSKRSSEDLKGGFLRHVCVRASEKTGEALLTLISSKDDFTGSKEFAKEVMEKHKELVGVTFNINKGSTNVIYGDKSRILGGRDFIYEEISNVKFKVSSNAFFQINTTQAETIINIIKSYLSDKNKNLLDAYCGVGFISLCLAGKFERVIGIEEVQSAIESAKLNAKDNNIQNAEFIFGKVENKIEDILESHHPDTVILDPPRIGCNKAVIEALLAKKPQTIIYVSCNPSTLVRDLEKLQSHYKIKSIQPVDMFPHTYHIENVVFLERIAIL